MKSMLYVGATLMIGASIYGFVDYKQTHNKKEFTEMYKEQKVAPVVPVINASMIEEKNETAPVAVTKPKKTVARNPATEEVIPAVRPIAENEKPDKKEAKAIENSTADVKTSPTTNVKKAKKKKKLDHRIFSRAPLRDEVEIEEVKLKSDEKKTVKNEQ